MVCREQPPTEHDLDATPHTVGFDDYPRPIHHSGEEEHQEHHHRQDEVPRREKRHSIHEADKKLAQKTMEATKPSREALGKKPDSRIMQPGGKGFGF